MKLVKYGCLFFCLMCSYSVNLLSNINLEENTQDFFKEIKQIILPEYPNAFNPSLVKWKGQWLMSFRLIEEDAAISIINSAADSKMGIVYLDENFNPVGVPQFICLSHPNQNRPILIVEDPRLVVKNDTLYVVYSGNKEAVIEDSGFRMYVAELQENDEGFFVLYNECLSIFEGENPNRREKNWAPFIFDKDLLLTYGFFPFKIFKPDLNTSEQCETIAKTYPSLIWEWGELRGGTPAVKLDEEHYLGIFHSQIFIRSIHSKGQHIPHYFMGAYLFSTTPPFEIKYISPEPIIGPNFYNGASYDPYWHPVCVVFPCGLVIDNDELLISYGRQDHEMWIAKIDKFKLLESLIHISTLVDTNDNAKNRVESVCPAYPKLLSFDMQVMLEKAKEYAKDNNDLLNYITKILNNKKFQSNPKDYLDAWKKERGFTKEYRMPEDAARGFFDANFKFT